jgi:SHS2 domain-containing protein
MIARIALSNPPDCYEIEHTADWAIHVRGATLPELFVNAATGMYGLMADLAAVTPVLERTLEVNGVDAEALLVNWLNELVYHTEIDGEVFCEFRIALLEPTHLRATARGGKGIQLKKQIKAVTFHNLQIISTNTGYETTIVFDV